MHADGRRLCAEVVVERLCTCDLLHLQAGALELKGPVERRGPVDGRARAGAIFCDRFRRPLRVGEKWLRAGGRGGLQLGALCRALLVYAGLLAAAARDAEQQEADDD